MILRYAVITTYERPDVARDCIDSCINAGFDIILVVDNGRDKLMPDARDDTSMPLYYVIRDDTQPVNLSQLWNLGLEWCEADAKGSGSWDVAILNDDTLLVPGWATRMQGELRSNYPAVAAFSGPEYAGRSILFNEPGPTVRMTGWAFMLRGEFGLRADEQFQWWFGDNDLDYQARLAGGTLMVPLGMVTNLFPNGYTTGERAARTAVDAKLFVEKWGRLPY